MTSVKNQVELVEPTVTVAYAPWSLAYHGTRTAIETRDQDFYVHLVHAMGDGIFFVDDENEPG